MQNAVITDEDYEMLCFWATGAIKANGVVASGAWLALRKRYMLPQELFIVGIDDPREFSTPTWGPFTEIDEAVEFIVTQFGNDAKYATLYTYEEGPVVRSYALDDGSHYHIRRLQSPM